jgi:competence protein ComEC
MTREWVRMEAVRGVLRPWRVGALVGMAVGLIVGVVGAAAGGSDLPRAAVGAGAALTLAAGTVLALVARHSPARPRPGAAFLFGALAALAGLGVAPPRADPDPPRGPSRVEGVVESVRAGAQRVDAIVRVRRAQPLDPGARAPARGERIRVRGSALPEGAEVEGTFALAPIAEFRNPSPHPRWPLLDPVAADARAIAVATRGGSWIGRARAHVRAALIAVLDEPACGVARALVLGDLALDAESAEVVRGAGLSHVLAVSGMHVTLLVGALVWVLRKTIAALPPLARRLEPGRAATALGVPLVLAYAPLAGGAPSAWRAAVTAAIAWALRAAGRRPRAGAVTAAAVIAVGAVDPETLARPAFLLSIAATAAILTPNASAADAGTPVAEPRPLRALAATSVRAAIATAPISLFCFDGVPIAGVAANLFVVPVAAALLLPLAALVALAASLAPFGLALPLAAAFDVVARGFLAACEAFASASVGRGLPPLDVAQGLVVAALAGFLLLARSFRARAIALATAVLALAGAELRLRAHEQPRGILRATFLDVGQGDSALVDLPDGRAMLIDTGGSVFGSPDPGRAAIAPLLRARRRGRIDVVVITHPHPDHHGGLDALLDTVELGEIWDTGQGEEEAPEEPLARTLARARASGIPVRRPAELCGRVHRFGPARVEVLWPCPAFDAGLDPNDNSFVLRVAFGARSLLWTGDVERHAETALVASGRLRPVDVLKVPHHGSRTSSSEAFLAALTPQVAIVSNGRGNRFGHPHPEVLARLERAVPEVVRIDREGGVIATTDGSTLSIETWSGRRAVLGPR